MPFKKWMIALLLLALMLVLTDCGDSDEDAEKDAAPTRAAIGTFSLEVPADWQRYDAPDAFTTWTLFTPAALSVPADLGRLLALPHRLLTNAIDPRPLMPKSTVINWLTSDLQPAADEATYRWEVFKNEAGAYALWLTDESGATFFAVPGEALTPATPCATREEGCDEGVPAAFEGYARLERGDYFRALQDLDPIQGEKKDLRFGPPDAPISILTRNTAGVARQRWTYDPAADTLTDTHTGIVYTADDKRGRFVAPDGETLQLVYYPDDAEAMVPGITAALQTGPLFLVTPLSVGLHPPDAISGVELLDHVVSYARSELVEIVDGGEAEARQIGALDAAQVAGRIRLPVAGVTREFWAQLALISGRYETLVVIAIAPAAQTAEMHPAFEKVIASVIESGEEALPRTFTETTRQTVAGLQIEMPAGWQVNDTSPDEFQMALLAPSGFPRLDRAANYFLIQAALPADHPVLDPFGHTFGYEISSALRQREFFAPTTVFLVARGGTALLNPTDAPPADYARAVDCEAVDEPTVVEMTVDGAPAALLSGVCHVDFSAIKTDYAVSFGMVSREDEVALFVATYPPGDSSYAEAVREVFESLCFVE